MKIEILEKAVLIIFLLIFTYQDIRKKEIYTFGLTLFYIAVTGMQVYKFLSGNYIDIKDIFFGIFSGALLFVPSRLNILGEGDAFVFMGTGAVLGFKRNLMLFFISVFIISIYALFMSIYCMVKKRKIKGMKVAMLPFITMANCIIWFYV
nr:prepilin peptidase [uncultured Lachnoanaerobaculum sp.]